MVKYFFQAMSTESYLADLALFCSSWTYPFRRCSLTAFRFSFFRATVSSSTEAKGLTSLSNHLLSDGGRGRRGMSYAISEHDQEEEKKWSRPLDTIFGKIRNKVKIFRKIGHLFDAIYFCPYSERIVMAQSLCQFVFRPDFRHKKISGSFETMRSLDTEGQSDAVY